MKGKVKWYRADKGFGFVTRDDGVDIFVHASSLVGRVPLVMGEVINFEAVEGEKGWQVAIVHPKKDELPG